MGIPVNGAHIFALQFADDKVLYRRIKATRKIKEEYEHWGLSINMENTKYLYLGGTGTNLQLDNDEIGLYQRYKYIGVQINQDGKAQMRYKRERAWDGEL